MVAYEAVTRSIRVVVRPFYLDQESSVMTRRFVFVYHVSIENEGEVEVQLLRRHWVIREVTGRVREVDGEGVIGLQPVIEPRGRHAYSSYSILQSLEGTMEGTYLMQLPSGERFLVDIPLFHLAAAAN